MEGPHRPWRPAAQSARHLSGPRATAACTAPVVCLPPQMPSPVSPAGKGSRTPGDLAGGGQPCEARVPQARSQSPGRELPRSETSLSSFQETKIAPNKVVMPLTLLLQKHNKVILQVVTVTLE